MIFLNMANDKVVVNCTVKIAMYAEKTTSVSLQNNYEQANGRLTPMNCKKNLPIRETDPDGQVK